MINILRNGSSGVFVSQWQAFLRGQGYAVNIDGLFGNETEAETRAFQKAHKLDIDGVVGNQTLGASAMRGFEIVDYSPQSSHFPTIPSFPPIVGVAQRQSVFGPLEFIPAPTAKNPEAIKITNNFAAHSIVNITIPELVGIPGAPGGATHFHRLVEKQFVRLWAAWGEAGLVQNILSYDGDYVPRFIRGKAQQQILSNHAFGTAFDINAKWNSYGAEPATWGQKGCVYELVDLASEHGFYWGGFFSYRDGMHFEVAKILP